ncbi:hypothetical protein OG984_09080 [Nocardioides sp. NBC_00368]|uniref:hypothetical protein n=1 Tax=Nocardioides sp. NBC_00368 TaxID=2976000 RepID=UPI002E2096A3
MRTAVDVAIDQIHEQFATHAVDVVREPGGDATIIIDEVMIGEQYEPSTTWLGFRISAAYPNADVYPHYLGPVSRRDGAAHGDAFQNVIWRDRSALQISRRSNGWNPRRDTAALKAVKVLAWLADQ